MTSARKKSKKVCLGDLTREKGMSGIFHGFELLLFKKFQNDPSHWEKMKKALSSQNEDSANEYYTYIFSAKESIPQSLWFLPVTLHNRPKYITELIQEELKREAANILRGPDETLLTTYLQFHQFTEFHLDRIFRYGDDNKLPKEIFKCKNVRYLSLKYNCLDMLPPDIGRMENLEYLALTNNKLQVQSIPYTITFCNKLRTLLLDNNLLDALPGCLLRMPSIQTVHRHGNHNYFKATFMWYHTDVEYRIIPVAGTYSNNARLPITLQFLAAKAMIGHKKDFYSDPSVANILKDYMSDIYEMFRICHHCDRACLAIKSGYKVVTFKNPYLGNSCVPFQHWACSIDCAKAIEVPARREQISAARQLDSRYEEYVQECHRAFEHHKQSRGLCGCMSPQTTEIIVERVTMEDTGEVTPNSDNESDVSSSTTTMSHVPNRRCVIL